MLLETKASNMLLSKIESSAKELFILCTLYDNGS